MLAGSFGDIGEATATVTNTPRITVVICIVTVLISVIRLFQFVGDLNEETIIR